MRILVTGATGYIGRRVVSAVCADGRHKVLTLNRDVEKATSLMPYVNCIHADSLDVDAVRRFAPEIVFHLATMSTSRNDTEIIDPMIAANITYGVRLLDMLMRIGSIKLFVNVGSFAEYRLGTEKVKDAYLYTATKSAFRHFVDYYADLCGFRYITAVPYTVYGGKDTAKKLIDYIVESLSAAVPVKMTKGEQVLDFVHVCDVVEFFRIVAERYDEVLALPQGTEFHLGTGVGTRVRDVAEMVEKAFGARCNIEWGGLPYRPLDVMYAVAPVGRNSETVGWRAKISLAEGVKVMAEKYC